MHIVKYRGAATTHHCEKWRLIGIDGGGPGKQRRHRRRRDAGVMAEASVRKAADIKRAAAASMLMPSKPLSVSRLS